MRFLYAIIMFLVLILVLGCGTDASVRWAPGQKAIERLDSGSVLDGAVVRFHRGDSVSEVRDWLESLEWVSTAGVREVRPGEYRIFIREHRPIARLSKSRILSHSGQVFSASNAEALPLVQLEGGPQHTQQQQLDLHWQLHQILSGSSLRMKALRWDRISGWTIDLVRGGKIVLGEGEGEGEGERVLAPRLEKLRYFIRVWPQLPERPRIDLRYPNALALGEVRENDGKRRHAFAE